MLINKITVGFVIQTFDTQSGECTGQEFIAGDEVDWETEQGERYCFPAKINNLKYHPFNMVQPTKNETARNDST